MCEKNKRNCGQITVFLSLLLTVLISVILTSLETVRVNQINARVTRSAVGASEHGLADFNVDLWDRYDLLFLDQTYNGKGTEELANRLQEYMEYTLSPSNDFIGQNMGLYDMIVAELETDQIISMLDNNFEELKKQMGDYAVIQAPVKKVDEVIEQYLGTDDGKVEKAKDQVTLAKEEEQKQKEEDKENSTPLPPNNSIPPKDPREGLKKTLSLGILNFVTDGDQTISKEEIWGERLPSAIKGQSQSNIKDKNTDFSDLKEMEDMLDTSKDDVEKDNLLDFGKTLIYINDHFKHKTNTKIADMTRFDYEVEYLIAGKHNDYDNLDYVVKRIMALRFPINFAYVVTDTEKTSQAMAMATGLVGFTGIVPLITSVKYLLLGALSYGETLIDVKALIQGKKIPLFKTYESWNLNLTDLLNMGNMVPKEDHSKTGLSYNNYLSILLLTQSKKDSLYLRIMDLIQLNIQLENKAFYIENCIHSFQLYSRIHVKELFFGLPFLKKSDINKNIYEFQRSVPACY